MRSSDLRAWLARAAAAAVTALLAVIAIATGALAASPTPSTAPGGDPRSSGQGPGLVGDPLFALVVVVVVAAVSFGATMAYVRLTGGPRRP